MDARETVRPMVRTPLGRRTGDSSPADVDRKLERLAWLLDDLFQIPGLRWRVGLDALVGLVPGIGDAITTAASLYVLAAAVRYRVPKVTVLRMGLNLAIDYALGSVPIVGDLLDAGWKANRKNLALLRSRGRVSPGEARRASRSDWVFVALVVLLLVAVAAGAAIVSLYVLTAVGAEVWRLLFDR